MRCFLLQNNLSDNRATGLDGLPTPVALLPCRCKYALALGLCLTVPAAQEALPRSTLLTLQLQVFVQILLSQ